MVAIITKISDGSVWAKSVNPLGEKTDYVSSWANPEFVNTWQQAESERVEFELHKDSIRLGNYQNTCVNCNSTFIGDKLQFVCLDCMPGLLELKFNVGDTIEVTREGNYFKII